MQATCGWSVMVNVVVQEASKFMAKEPFKWVRKHPFFAIHVAYFLVLSLVGALSLWAAPKAEPLSFLDALYNAVSAVTETGLAGVPMHRFSLSDQITLLLLMVVGGQVFSSLIPLFLRRLVFNNRNERDTDKGFNFESPKHPQLAKTDNGFNFESPKHPQLAKTETDNGALHPSLPTETWAVLPHTTEDHMQRKAMEHEAIVTMSWVTAWYYLFSITTGFVVCQICILHSPHASALLKQSQVNSSLFSMFATVSAFGNCGYILLDENMVPLQRSWVMLLCLCTLMLLGNTLYAPTLRFLLWALHKRAIGERKRVYAYILGSKERHFTHIFPKDATIWLVASVVFWNACQVMCMLGIDWRCDALKGLGAGYKLVAALFQSIASRTGGMNAVNLSGFSSPTLFVSLVAMYVASYPIYQTRKYEGNFFGAQLCSLRSKDSLLFAAISFICFFERTSVKEDPLNFSFFNIIYEVVSAYGNVGLTIGYNCNLKMIMASTSKCMDIPCAFSGKWSNDGKMVLILVMMFGRHRNLLEDLDWDITFPMNMSS